MLDTINEIKKNICTYKNIGKLAKQHIKENFTWELYADMYLEKIESQFNSF